MEEKIKEQVMKELGWDKAPKYAITRSLREALVERAMEGCHETGEIDSYIEFVAKTVTEFLSTHGDDHAI